MSIAKDEAEKKYSRDVALTATFAGNVFRRAGYVDGRTAEPTKAEIKAAINEWDGHGYCCRVGDPITCICGMEFEDEHEYLAHVARAMLEAARKAVSE